MRILHLFDGQADWEERIAAAQLLDRLSPERHTQTVASLSPRRPGAEWFNGQPVWRIPYRLDVPILAAPRLRQSITRRPVDVVHTWGLAAARAAVAARPKGCALVLSRYDPCVNSAEARLVRTLCERGRFAVSCSSATVRRRLIERGLPPECCVVIRPGVDFGRINAAQKDHALRSRLDLEPDQRVIVAAAPVSRRGGHDRAVWAAHMHHYIHGLFRMIVYGDTQECRRLHRLTRGFPNRQAIVWADSSFRYEDLVSIADALVVAALDDVPTTPIGWAMAANVPVLGTAVYSVAELIAHRHNGLLLKPEAGAAFSVRLAAGLDEIDSLAKERELARGQAFEVFGIRRFVEQSTQLYENLAADRSPEEGITDSAYAL